MAKPFKLKSYKQLPVIKTTELRKIFEHFGFTQTEENHKHIKFTKGEIEQILIKGNKDINPNLLKKIINQLATKLKISEEEIIKRIMKKK